MRAVTVKILEILDQNPPQMLSLEHDHVVQTLAPAGVSTT
jgi:hypothetical protein